LRLLTDDQGTLADGLVISVENERVFRLHYQVRCDLQWRCLRAELELLGKQGPGLLLTKEPEGDWIRNGQAVPATSSCIDIDIAATPFTNTLPIRRLGLREGQAAEISALYIQVPDLAISAVRQKYRCVRERARYTYQGLDGREYGVVVDADGLVTDYEGIFKRVWARP
jgi:hypothetical protein